MSEEKDKKLEMFKLERNEALLSLDEGKIRAFHLNWNGKTIPQGKVFWGSIHKAITGCLDLPLEFRKQSKKWLNENNLKSLDDGDL